MRRGFFGGTFNPAHLGHVRAARAAAAELGLEALYVIPAGTPPHKELPKDGADARQRMEMAALAFQGIPGLEVLDWELRRPGRSYTAETVDRLLTLDPAGEWWMLCGTDMFETLPEWYRGDWLLKTLRIAVYPRKAGEEARIDELSEQYRREYDAVSRRIHVEPLDISSTRLRAMLREGEGAKYLPEQVYAYLLKARLYSVRPEPEALWALARPWYKESRIPHVRGCREEAVKLARRWGADVLDAEVAAILHDITKKLPLEEQLHICEKRGMIVPNFRREYEAMLHAFSGAAAAALEFGVSPAVEEAIRWHTTGKANMSLLEKVLWLADYMEPGRTTPGVEKVRALAYRDLDEALTLALENSLSYLEGKGFAPHPATREALAYLRGEKE
ncbi:MAG: nicotinate (nicotinamide) nucleotide adenylyltransferase [Oscillospiraceae bacterium]|nr:nicotinate (nicotinamide) nucleotide adenylyltransferase [Oscillospiraceae bacterium]